MQDNEIAERLGEIWADAGGNNREEEFVTEAIATLVRAALWLAVDGFDEHSDDDTEAIEAGVRKKVSDLLLTEMAKINGT